MPPGPAIALAGAVSPATNIVSLSTSLMPFTGMPGVVRYLAQHYSFPYSVASSITISGEFVVVRLEDDLQKAYDYAFGTAPCGQTVFIGPFKQFNAHHTSSASSTDIRAFFGHHPWIAIGGSGLTSA
jgi:formate-dependent phosphoribosylglycinamide formyltransferase (GAR transformylase)